MNYNEVVGLAYAETFADEFKNPKMVVRESLHVTVASLAMPDTAPLSLKPSSICLLL